MWSGSAESDGVVVAVGEAKQKLVGAAEVLAAAQAAGEANVGCLVYAALAPQQDWISAADLAAERYGVAVEIHVSTRDLVRASLVRTTRPLAETLEAFPVIVHDSLVALDAPAASVAEWDALITAWLAGPGAD